MLGLEIEYLVGSAFAAHNEYDAQVDWPPQPDRIYSALVASWGARGEILDERNALEWLEKQRPPRIVASTISNRMAPTVFVAPNDFKTSTSNFDVIPARRSRQARRFPGGHLRDPMVHLVWDAKPEPGICKSLDALARDTAYIGHSSSLTRCRFIEQDFDVSEAQDAKRVVYEGRLTELERAFKRGLRPNPGYTIVAQEPAVPAVPRSVFSDRWIVLTDDGGTVPDIRATPLVMRKMRDALMGAYERVHGAIPEWLSGHREDGSPSQAPHVAVVPLADVGWEHSQSRVMGCAIVLPRSVSNDALNSTIGTLLEARDLDDNTNIELHYGGVGPWYLRPTESPERASHKPRRWTRNGRLWASATPIVLDRFPKARDGAARENEIIAMISRACENIGLPKPSHVLPEATSFISGAPAASAPRNAPLWQHWQVPRSLAGRYMTHATIGFDQPVDGPLLLGAGRYVGLGLCMPDWSK